MHSNGERMRTFKKSGEKVVIRKEDREKKWGMNRNA
jgi:hypothetical protein